MIKLEVRIRYLISDLWVDPSLMGWTRRFESGGESIEIRFPESPDEFTAADWETETPPTPSVVPVPGVYDEPGWDSRTLAVRLLAVSVTLEADLPSERPEDPFEGEYGTALQQAYERGLKRSEKTMQAFLEWLRALSRQPWLGLVADAPRQYGRGGVYYAATGEPIAGFGRGISRTFTSSRSRVNYSQLDEAIRGIEQGNPVPPSQALLADAWHLMDGTDRPDRIRAIILAAIACEIRAQEHLRAAANEHNESAINLLLRKGSTLQYLLNDVMTVVCDTSLKESDPELARHVQSLSANRNSLVHEGITSLRSPLLLSAPEIGQRVFNWLESHAHQQTAAAARKSPAAQT
ncbi:hypothetical protein SAMN04489743_1260 [Pseudarthrobacter equi]|uniref:Apea-like HEPN domain-containing protein n=1 Tax=Pseudarthrobacter equi TaxID=728066 RepID=A0A1H1WBS8_9MICC|nr:hypothetical protein [Pseudarthrobacter equi]SDS93866.1 hypothetical protein SAMN04489743_1260 [Pseudarthrobacter equi]